MPIIFANCTHPLARTQEKKLEDVFFVKIANKGTTLNRNVFHLIGTSTGTTLRKKLQYLMTSRNIF